MTMRLGSSFALRSCRRERAYRNGWRTPCAGCLGFAPIQGLPFPKSRSCGARTSARWTDIGVSTITPEAGGQKSETDRDVPLHEHLIEQGFIDFSRQFRPSDPIFHYYEMPEVAGDLNDREEHRERAASAAANVSGRLSKWVRSLGVKDPDVDPNHGWRHRFKTEGRAVGMDPMRSKIRQFCSTHYGSSDREAFPDSFRGLVGALCLGTTCPGLDSKGH
jgi:hypothetical protein